MRVHSTLLRRAVPFAVLFLISLCAPARAGQGSRAAGIGGQLYHSVSLDPVPSAIVVIEELGLEVKSDRNGRYRIDSLTPGTYHVVIAAPGFHPARVEVVVKPGESLPCDVALDPELYYTEVVSVSPEARSQFESYQPTTVLEGQELSKQLAGTIGATLASEPGVAERSFGPASARPVIRGMDGDRVLILEDGQRMGDLSSQSGDHGVTVNPAMSPRIEVVRGPATLLYGSSAIGGLVNVISDVIPTTPRTGVSGGLVADLGSAAAEAGAAADIEVGNGTWALHGSGAGRRSGDYETPEGTVDNTQSRNGSTSLGLAWTHERGYVGGSYGYDDTRYGIPIIEGGQIQLTPRRHVVNIRAGAHDLAGLFSSFQATVAYRRYRHEELEGREVGTRFENDTIELDARASQRPFGKLSGTVGAWGLTRSFSAIGEEALSPPIDETGVAAFLYEEVKWEHLTAQFGGRLDRATFEPKGDRPARDFTDLSGSAGLVFHPSVFHERVSVSFSLASAARHPALEELYFFGPHPGNFAFEIGNPDLKSERALGFDLSFRWNTRRFTGEVTYFRNGIDDFIFRNPVSDEEFDAKYGHEAQAGAGEGHGAPEFPVVAFVGADSLLQGVEVHTDAQLARHWFAEASFDYVRGELRAPADPLPRIPPMRLRGGLRYQVSAFQAGGEVVGVATQDRVLGAETPTDGYTTLRLFAAYSFGSRDVVHTITARLENATNELYRNHLSYIKDVVPEMGRNFRLVYNVRF